MPKKLACKIAIFMKFSMSFILMMDSLNTILKHCTYLTHYSYIL